MAKTYKVVLESSYVGCDEEFYFDMPEDATMDEVEKEGFNVLMGNIVWYCEEGEENGET